MDAQKINHQGRRALSNALSSSRAMTRSCNLEYRGTINGRMANETSTHAVICFCCSAIFLILNSLLFCRAIFFLSKFWTYSGTIDHLSKNDQKSFAVESASALTGLPKVSETGEWVFSGSDDVLRVGDAGPTAEYSCDNYFRSWLESKDETFLRTA
jgi:hypothetical protein